jgi:hypothetical protein
MKKKTVIGTTLLLLLVLQVQTLYARDDDYYAFYKEIEAGNLSRAERILKSNARKWNAAEQQRAWQWVLDDDVSNARSLEAVKLLQKYNVNWGDTTVGYPPLFYKKSEELVRYLINSGMPLDNVTVFYAIRNGYGDNLVQFLLDKGGRITEQDLQQAAEKKRWTLVPLLVSRLGEDDMSYRYTRADATTYYNSQSSDYRSKNPFSYDPVRSKTALMFAAESGQLNMVRLLVEKGARVNLRADGGETAASLAYDNGEIEIYNYLKANGAIDFEPRQVAQQPAAPAPAPSSTTNVYVQQPAPTQSAPSEPSRNTGREIADSINRAFESPLENGRYRISGRAEEIVFAGIAKAGNVSYKDAAGTTHRGTYSIDGNRLTINVMGKSFFYNITSKTSFSGNGESWYRTGF